ncbi:MAG: hypothetical protein LBR26_13150 [Prevotella sp.]|jgi:hypothetical protein|nr:hypothetical protein [Prevotella sp.]
MQKRSLQQVIDDAKAGVPVDPPEYRDAILALHTMLVHSRMMLESIADKMDNATDLFYVTRAYLGNINVVRMEREAWMNTVPAEYLRKMNN